MIRPIVSGLALLLLTFTWTGCVTLDEGFTDDLGDAYACSQFGVYGLEYSGLIYSAYNPLQSNRLSMKLGFDEAIGVDEDRTVEFDLEHPTPDSLLRVTTGHNLVLDETTPCDDVVVTSLPNSVIRTDHIYEAIAGTATVTINGASDRAAIKLRDVILRANDELIDKDGGDNLADVPIDSATLPTVDITW